MKKHDFNLDPMMEQEEEDEESERPTARRSKLIIKYLN